jgi:hypothetical protein
MHQVREVARVELDRIPRFRQLATGQDERGLVAIGPTESLSLEVQCGGVGSRAHDVAVDGLEEFLDELRGLNVPVLERVYVSSQSTRPSFLAMNPSRLATMWMVTQDSVLAIGHASTLSAIA